MSNARSLFCFLVPLSLTVYVLTLAPTITWRNDGVDSGDLATAVSVGGVPHPPGYPTYLILGELIKHVPIGDVAYRLNLLSAICAALTVGLVGLIIAQTLSSQVNKIEDLNGSHHLIWICALAASLALAFVNTFWSQAVITEVYTLNAFFAALMLYGTMHVRPVNERWLLPLVAGLMGLGLGNHLSILLFTPLLIGIVRIRWRWQLVASMLLAFSVGVSVYAIIPWRAGRFPAINWGLATTWPNFLWLVSAEIYRPYFFALPWQFVPARIVGELRLLAEAFMGWGLPIGLLGLYGLFRAYRSLALGSLTSFLLISIYAIGYNTTDSYVLLLPALLIVSIWIGWGLVDLAHTLQKPLGLTRGRHLIRFGIMLLPLASFWWNYSEQNISLDNEAYNYAEQSLQRAAPQAIIITADDSHTFALWYGRYALELRSDVAIINANLLSYAWYQQTLKQTHPHLLFTDHANRPVTTLTAFIEMNRPQSPIYLATFPPPELEGYQLQTIDPLYRVDEKLSQN